MKRLITTLFLAISFLCSAQLDMKKELKASKDFQKELQEFYKNKKTSILKPKDLKKHKKLDIYPVSEDYIIMAKLERTPEAEPLQLATTTERMATYVQYGILHFEWEGKPMQLPIYQDINASKKPGYTGWLFLPFTDLTNGSETYGGGRYINAYIPEGEDFVLNFNLAYNPYCAYNERYSCPIVPEANHLDIEIRAGVMAFDK